MILPTWFDNLEESFCYKEVQCKIFCPTVKTRYPPAEDVNGTPECRKKYCALPDHWLFPEDACPPYVAWHYNCLIDRNITTNNITETVNV